MAWLGLLMPLPEEAFAHRVKSQSMKIPQINGKTISRNKGFLEVPPPTSCKMESLRKYRLQVKKEPLQKDFMMIVLQALF